MTAYLMPLMILQTSFCYIAGPSELPIKGVRFVLRSRACICKGPLTLCDAVFDTAEFLAMVCNAFPHM